MDPLSHGTFVNDVRGEGSEPANVSEVLRDGRQLFLQAVLPHERLLLVLANGIVPDAAVEVGFPVGFAELRDAADIAKRANACWARRVS